MREILFRGIDEGTKEWVYGYYCERRAQFHTGREYSIFDDKTMSKYSVIPETVGQHTGLYDNTKWDELTSEEQAELCAQEWKGKPIFEGDIVQYYGTYPLEVYIESGHTKVRWFDTGTNTDCVELFFGYDEEAYGECKIIGNIHDNPELLKGGAE